MALEGEEGRGKLRKAWGSRTRALDPRISEWGNPAEPQCSAIARGLDSRAKPTRRSDTSQYPVEEKSTEILLVAASERGRA